MDNSLFIQISTLLVTTVSLAFIVRFFKQPLLVAYMISGIICGPLFLNLLHGESHLYHAFSSFGIALLLFIVGLELNFSYLKKIGKLSLIVGIFQFILNFVLVFTIATNFFSLGLMGAIFLSLAACFSSTIVVLKLLNDKRDEESVYGRYTVGILLIQDLISIVILFCLSIFYPTESTGINSDSIFKILGVLTLIIVSYKFLLPKILDKIASSGEFLFIFTITWCFGLASLMLWSGLSLELGAVIAGITMGSSKYQPEIVSRVKPLRDFFIILFFIIL